MCGNLCIFSFFLFNICMFLEYFYGNLYTFSRILLFDEKNDPKHLGNTPVKFEHNNYTIIKPIDVRKSLSDQSGPILQFSPLKKKIKFLDAHNSKTRFDMIFSA